MMNHASELRGEARRALQGHWGVAVLAGVLVSLLTSGLGGFGSIDTAGQELGLRQMEALSHAVWGVMSAGLVTSAVAIVIGGAIEMGYASFNLNLVGGQPVRIGMLFSFMERLKDGIGLVLLRFLYLFLWALLPTALLTAWVFAIAFNAVPDRFVPIMANPQEAMVFSLQLLPVVIILFIPVIAAAYRYLLAPYLMAENPGLRAREALRLSGKMMRGMKWQAFCLHLSFIGWQLLSVFTFGIGILWVKPYMAAADAAFYKEVCRRRDITQPESFRKGPEL